VDDAALAGVIVRNTIVLICDGFACTVCGGGNGGFSLAARDYFDTAMVNCYGRHLLRALSYFVPFDPIGAKRRRQTGVYRANSRVSLAKHYAPRSIERISAPLPSKGGGS